MASSDVFPYLPTISASAAEPAIPTATVMSNAVPIAVTLNGDADVSRYYDQPFVVDCDSLMSCYDHNGDLSSVDAFACRNSSFQSGTFLFSLRALAAPAPTCCPHTVVGRPRGLLTRWVTLEPPRPTVATHLSDDSRDS